MRQRKSGSRFYFYSVLVAYLLGLVATYFAMMVRPLARLPPPARPLRSRW